MDANLLKQSLKNGCPKCGEPNIFPHRLTLDVKGNCASCGFKISNHDSGDGPAVFLVFILGFLLTPLALLADHLYIIPLWAHAIIWTIAAVGICIFTMQPLKTYVITLNYKHRRGAKNV